MMWEEAALEQEAAIAYIRQRLREGGTLAQLLNWLPLERFQFVTYVPAISSARVQDLAVGGATSRGASEQWLLSQIQPVLLRSKDKCVVFEDALAQIGDPLFEGCPYVTVCSEIYCYTNVAANSATIIRAIQSATSYRFLCVFTSLPELDALHCGLAVDPALLVVFAARAEGLAVGAYDGKGFLLACLSQQ